MRVGAQNNCYVAPPKIWEWWVTGPEGMASSSGVDPPPHPGGSIKVPNKHIHSNGMGLAVKKHDYAIFGRAKMRTVTESLKPRL